jgi:deoxyribose-phosphate aldolase
MDNDLARRIELVFAAELPTRAEIKKLCERATREKMRSVAVPSGSLVLAHHFLEETTVKISCRIGFPHGTIDGDVKRYEAEVAVDAGAHEIEFVPSLSKIADGDYSALLREIRDVVEAAEERPVKVAVEPSQWQSEVLREIVQVVLDSGAQYICADDLETGQVQLLRELCGPKFGILAPAEDLAQAPDLIAAGATVVAIHNENRL